MHNLLCDRRRDRIATRLGRPKEGRGLRRAAVCLILLALTAGDASAADLRIACQATGGASHKYEETNAFRWQDMERSSISATLTGTGWEFRGTAIETSPFGHVSMRQRVTYTVSVLERERDVPTVLRPDISRDNASALKAAAASTAHADAILIVRYQCMLTCSDGRQVRSFSEPLCQ
jgi:hypothetical protein